MASNGSKSKGGLHLVHGSDETAVKKAAAALSERLAPEDSMNFEIVDGAVDTVDEAVRSVDEVKAAILTLPFMGGGKLVWWKHLSFLDDSVVGRSARVKEALEALVPELDKVDGQTVTLLVSATAFHKGRAFPKALLKAAEVTAKDLPDLRYGGEEAALERIDSECRALGLQPEPAAVERLFQALGMNFAQLPTELEKLAVAAGPDGRLTRELVQQMVGGKREAVVWDFCDAVLAGRAREATALLGDLLAQGESEVGVLILLSNQIRLAALAGVLDEQRLARQSQKGRFRKFEVVEEGQALLPKKKNGDPVSTFNLGRVAGLARHRPAAHWMRAVDTLYQANRNVLSGTVDKVRAVELAVYQIAA
ncbi:MAG: DNA polymerase III subunit delta [Verrucomicrobiota bacterium]